MAGEEQHESTKGNTDTEEHQDKNQRQRLTREEEEKTNNERDKTNQTSQWMNPTTRLL